MMRSKRIGIAAIVVAGVAVGGFSISQSGYKGDFFEAVPVAVRNYFPNPPAKKLEELARDWDVDYRMFLRVKSGKGSGAAMGENSSETLNVISWNIWGGRNADETVRTITEHADFVNADIILLQEVPGSSGTSKGMIEELSRRTGFRYAWGVFRYELDAEKKPSASIGNMVMSRHEITDASLLRLPSGYNWIGDGRLGGPIALKAKIRKGRKEFLVYNVHLEGWTSPEYRRNQVQRVIKDVGKYGGSIIVGGDFNAIRSGPYSQEPLLELMGKSRFYDSAGQSPESTMNRLDAAFARAAGFSYGALDRIFSKNLFLKSHGVLPGLTASDHLPFQAEYWILK